MVGVGLRKAYRAGGDLTSTKNNTLMLFKQLKQKQLRDCTATMSELGLPDQLRERLGVDIPHDLTSTKNNTLMLGGTSPAQRTTHRIRMMASRAGRR